MAVIEQVLVQVAIKRREFLVGCHCYVLSIERALRFFASAGEAIAVAPLYINDSMTVETNDGLSDKSPAAACAAPRCCAGWCARPGSRPTISSSRYFVCPGRGVSKPVNSMPGVAQLSVDMVVREAREIAAAGVPAVILFGIPEHKDAIGSEAWNDSGEVQRAIREIKEHVPGLVVITDVCMCEYTDHGHCGAIKRQRR